MMNKRDTRHYNKIYEEKVMRLNRQIEAENKKIYSLKAWAIPILFMIVTLGFYLGSL